MSLRLRPYQDECLTAILEKQSIGVNRQLIHLPTGAGKTVIFSELIRRFPKPCLVLAHTNELVEQAASKIEMLSGEKPGILNGFNKDFDAPVIVSSIQSAIRPQNREKLLLKGVKLVIYDECHRSAAESPSSLLHDLSQTCSPLIVGFSATPFRNDGRGLGEIFDDVTFSMSIAELIEAGYLVRPQSIKVAHDLDLTAVKKDGDDFSSASLAQVMDTPSMRNLVVEAFEKSSPERQTICFGVSVEHALNLCCGFRAKGFKAEVVSGSTPKAERDRILRDYREGRIQILCNCQILTEGFDAPETSCVIVARPTKSVGLFQQMAGRGLRLFPNKSDCLILDFCDRAHSICSTAVLLGDAEFIKAQEEEREIKRRIAEERKTLPKDLNPKLKNVLLEQDLISQPFTWERLSDGTWRLKGQTKVIEVAPLLESGSYAVTISTDDTTDVVSQGLSFEYAFSLATELAREIRKDFVLRDREAEWRKRPVTEGQIHLFRSYGYRKGIDRLNRGQASDLIGSGILKQKAARTRRP